MGRYVIVVTVGLVLPTQAACGDVTNTPKNDITPSDGCKDALEVGRGFSVKTELH